METTENTLTTGKVWNEYNSRLRKFILREVKDEFLADDILHDSFVKIHLHLDALKDRSKITSWLFQITRNVIADHRRKSSKNFLIDLAAIEIADLKERRETVNLRGCMNTFLSRLPERYKEAIEQVDLKGLSQLQFAEKLRISYSGAKSRVQRARRLLHGYMVACCEITSDKYGNIISSKPRGASPCGCQA
jgi:RNA polymerase sigma-70 factor (ECF subfamily)